MQGYRTQLGTWESAPETLPIHPGSRKCNRLLSTGQRQFPYAFNVTGPKQKDPAMLLAGMRVTSKAEMTAVATYNFSGGRPIIAMRGIFTSVGKNRGLRGEKVADGCTLNVLGCPKWKSRLK
jgi:hypothetical protein